jgi:regulation of enolase protein 1 (concanavalin A-like superfamily)
MKNLKPKHFFVLFLLIQSSIFYSQNFPIVGFGDAANYTIGTYTVPGSSGLDLHWYGGIRFGDNSGNSIMQITNGKVGIGTTAPETLLNVNVGSGGTNGVAGIRVGGLNNYSSLEFGIDGDYDGMIRSFGNNINYYAGHWKTKGIIASENHSHNWYTSKNGSSDWSSVKMTLNENGNLGIETTAPDEKLTVKGKIHTQEVRVDMAGPLVPDYVFAEDYKLKSLQEVEDFIKENKHLPEIPSAQEIEKNGLMLAEMNMNLLKKMEEMTLYMIEMKKENQEIKNENQEMKKDIAKLKQIIK